MEVSVHEAKTHLSRLIRRAADGEEIVISRRGRPMVKLQPVHTGKPEIRFGKLKDLVVSMGDDFDDELEDFVDFAPPPSVLSGKAPRDTP